MADGEPVTAHNLDGYGAPPIPWNRVRARFDTDTGITPTHWLATVRPDSRPHVMAVWAVWVEGAFCFVAGAGSRKAKNLAHNPHCVLTVASEGVDVVVEGVAAVVRDADKLQQIAAVFASQGWHPTVSAGAFYADFGAPSAGPPPWDVYELTLETVFAVGTTAPHGATRWRFSR